MAYTNKESQLLDALAKLMYDEFTSAVEVLWGPPDTARASHWFEVSLVDSEPVDQAAFYVARRYRFQILYLMRNSGDQSLQRQRERYEVAARMQRFLIDYTQDTTSAWFDGRIGRIEYGYRPPDRQDDNLTGVLIEWSCTVPESIS